MLLFSMNSGRVLVSKNIHFGIRGEVSKGSIIVLVALHMQDVNDNGEAVNYSSDTLQDVIVWTEVLEGRRKVIDRSLNVGYDRHIVNEDRERGDRIDVGVRVAF